MPVKKLAAVGTILFLMMSLSALAIVCLAALSALFPEAPPVAYGTVALLGPVPILLVSGTLNDILLAWQREQARWDSAATRRSLRLSNAAASNQVK